MGSDASDPPDLDDVEDAGSKQPDQAPNENLLGQEDQDPCGKEEAGQAGRHSGSRNHE